MRKTNTIEDLILSIKQSLAYKNYYGALALALTLPDICSDIEYPGQSTSKRYSEWFEKYLSNKYSNNSTIFISGKDCYAIRCGFLHNANEELTQHKIKETIDKYKFITGSSHNFKIDKYIILNVEIFCKDICDSAYLWLTEINFNKEKNNKINNLITIETQGFSPVPGMYINL